MHENAKANRKRGVGRCGAWAGIVHVLIWGDPTGVPVSRACPKGGPCIRKLLGACRKSAEGIVAGPRGQRRPEGNEQVRVTVVSRCRLLGDEPPYGDQSVAAIAVTQWLEFAWQHADLKLVLNRRMRNRMLGGVGAAGSYDGGYPISPSLFGPFTEAAFHSIDYVRGKFRAVKKRKL